MPWMLGIGGLLLAVLGGFGWIMRRRARREPKAMIVLSEDGGHEGAVAAGEVSDTVGHGPPGDVPSNAATGAVADVALFGAPPEPPAIELILNVRRAGTNLLKAAVDYELTVVNRSDAPINDLSLGLCLISACDEQDALLAQFFDAALTDTIVPPFAIGPGDASTMSGMAMLDKEALTVLRAGDRLFFVPIIAVTARWDGGTRQTGMALVIGVDRGEGAKMGPFRLDSGPRMFDTVATRPHVPRKRQ